MVAPDHQLGGYDSVHNFIASLPWLEDVSWISTYETCEIHDV